MLNTPACLGGMVTAPHHLAADAGAEVLRAGGNAAEAMVAAAAAIAVVYPHMNSIGGDGFWLIRPPAGHPVAILAAGPAGVAVRPELYGEMGYATIPSRGPLAANTVAGTVGGWGAALDVARELGGTRPLPDLLAAAIGHADSGVVVTVGQSALTADKRPELEDVSGFADTFLPGGAAPAAGTVLKQPRLAATLRRIAEEGPDGFYRGALARTIAADLEAAGSPVTAADMEAYRATVAPPLSLRLRHGTVYNTPPPTQGLASLMILAIGERLAIGEADGFDHLHGLVEASKQAFLVRDAEVGDPAAMTSEPADFLGNGALDRRAAAIDTVRALPWGAPSPPGDTVWMGAIDRQGCAVSFIQSTYWEYGSGVVLGETGITWQNRGSSFLLDPGHPRSLAPGRLPFHTLNPAIADLDDGRVMVYGAMGGEGQPQTQAAVYSRHVWFGQGLQAAVTAPRWLLGRTWGAETATLKLESRFGDALVARLREAGHDVEMLGPFEDDMGHAGAVVRHPNGVIEGATDPRSDGQARGF